LDNLNYDHFHGGSDFSHAYVIMHKYFGKKTKNVKNEYISFYNNLTFFLHENFLHIFSTFGATNSKPNDYKNQLNEK
jgi:hypothetical protein